jgi:hypothetical protein
MGGVCDVVPLEDPDWDFWDGIDFGFPIDRVRWYKCNQSPLHPPPPPLCPPQELPQDELSELDEKTEFEPLNVS